MPRSDAIFVFARWSQYIPIFFLVLNEDLEPAQVGAIVKSCVLAALLVAVAVVLEALVIGVDRTQVRGAGLISEGFFTEGSVANYNVVAAYLTTVALLFAPFALSARKRRKRFGILAVMLLTTGVWLTTSRSGLLAFLVGFVFLGVRYFRRRLLLAGVTLVPSLMVGMWFLRDTSTVRAYLKMRYFPQALPMLFGASFASTGIPASAWEVWHA
jgi:hypothetical protein